MTATSTISSKYQVSIPKTVRERLAWKPGQKVAFIDKGHGVLMIRVPEREELVGIARGANVENYRDRNDRY
ncbi:MAG TPA: AbrB/MazE/SpoVT family DNA-binding domain-containing protein [Roseiarcus sp.]|nr:AbrB/MazE/SpoVT family DNA-binding domain-containing protein [Roseiarcus sp.]